MIRRLIIISSLFIGCTIDNNKKPIGETKKTIDHQITNQSTLKNEVLFSGDIEAYQLLKTEYLNYAFYEEILLYAMIMANKHDYPQAYFDVFTCLTDIYLSDLNQIDEITASIAIEYLIKAADKGHHQAKEMVEEYKITTQGNSKQQIERIFKE